MRCYDCGERVAEGLMECPACHAALWAVAPAIAASPRPITLAANEDMSLAATPRHAEIEVPRTMPDGTAMQWAQNALSGAGTLLQSVIAFVIHSNPSVQGRVIIAEPVYSEEPDFDTCRFISRLLWVLIMLPFILAAGLFCLIFRCLSPINLFAMLGVFRFLNPVARSGEQVPVRYFRIRDDNSDAEVMVRIKGRIYGSLATEDRVTLMGRFRDGTFHVHDGFNHRTQSRIRVEKSYSWVGLLLTIAVILSLCLLQHEPLMRSVGGIGGAP